jgi:hypothetical protein
MRDFLQEAGAGREKGNLSNRLFLAYVSSLCVSGCEINAMLTPLVRPLWLLVPNMIRRLFELKQIHTTFSHWIFD